MPESTKTSEEIRLIVGKGDTLYGLLTDKGVSPLDATSIIRELKPVFSPRNLKSGHILAMTLNRNQATGIIRPRNMEIRTGNSKRYAVRLNGKGEYERIGKSVKIASIPRPLSALRSGGTSRYSRARARIQSSFYQSALAQDLPPGIVNKMTGILSYDVDFQREVNRGDTFEVLYTRQSAKDNGVLYAELVTNRKKHAFYRFKTPDGMVGYYNKNGESAQKAFMRTPVSGARITSRFGRRKHPILGYTKMHTGVDFGVARGTPIYAAASGTIQKAGWAGGYGKYVRIQHSKKLATAYGHMSRIARGIRPGKKVSQGQIIGYVGSTGRSTGPHLHYEIRLSGKPVNPMRYKLAKGSKKLSRKWLALFKKEKSRIDRLRKQIPVATNIASIRN
ncbi:MAG TPA: M23 family metallopeptidase [Rhizobiales bacterium]|nr:M23 family metallopeptidase [Hyphomicrobiales bacterium]